jgi:magnesium transporter
MITAYFRDGPNIRSKRVDPDDPLPDNLIWVDLLAPTSVEIERMERDMGIDLPEKSEVWKNQILNRLYVHCDHAFLTAALITKVDSPYPSTAPAIFILGPAYLLTIHEIAPTSFRNFAARLQNPAEQFPTPLYALEGLLEEMITRVAHNSEIVVDTLDRLSHDIFGSALIEEPMPEQASPVRISSSSSLLQGVLKKLGAAADLNSKINESLHSIQRMLIFLKQEVSEDSKIDAKIDILLSDTAALLTQSAFMSDKVTFQLDATLGMINVEQNLIIKIFSMVAVFFLPPTLIASLYGMNFDFMPELNWHLGYPIALFMMFLSAAIPFVYFRRRGWL